MQLYYLDLFFFFFVLFCFVYAFLSYVLWVWCEAVLCLELVLRTGTGALYKKNLSLSFASSSPSFASTSCCVNTVIYWWCFRIRARPSLHEIRFEQRWRISVAILTVVTENTVETGYNYIVIVRGKIHIWHQRKCQTTSNMTSMKMSDNLISDTNEIVR